MANSGEVEAEYESEPEKSLLQRRREASDDDDGVEEDESSIAERLNGSVRRIRYAGESDGGDGAPEYYDEDYDDDEVSYIDALEKLGEQVEKESQDEPAEQVTETKQRGNKKVNDADDDEDAFAVPTIGGFYMHDDRFGGGRRGRRRGRRRIKDIWESKDELKWTHDKFEELTLGERHNEELNAFEVRSNYHRGRKKNNTKRGGYKANESRPNSKSGNSGSSSKIVKGRGPVRYKPLSRSSFVNSPIERMQLEKSQRTSSKRDSARVLSANSKQLDLKYQMSFGKPPDTFWRRALSIPFKERAKSFEMTGDYDSSTVFSTKSKQHGDLGMASYTSASIGSSAGSESVPFDQHLLALNMSSYQQVYHPASSFHYDSTCTPKGMELPGSRNIVPQGNNAQDIPYAKEGVSLAAENYFTKSPFPYPVPGSTYMPSFESRDLRIGSSMSLTPIHQATLVPNLLNGVSSLAQHSILQQVPVDSIIQPPSQVLAHQFHSCLGNRSQKLVEASSLSFHEHRILNTLTGSIQSKAASLGTGSNIPSPPQNPGIQDNQNSSATPIVFPGQAVMQIKGLHQGGRLGSHATDTTSTGYAGDSRVHLRNPDLTWLPVLPAAAAAGAVGATYSSPIVAPDGSFYDYVEQTAEQGNNKRGTQQFKPRRYSRINMA